MSELTSKLWDVFFRGESLSRNQDTDFSGSMFHAQNHIDSTHADTNIKHTDLMFILVCGIFSREGRMNDDKEAAIRHLQNAEDIISQLAEDEDESGSKGGTE